jgi:hypothetical protein
VFVLRDVRFGIGAAEVESFALSLLALPVQKYKY